MRRNIVWAMALVLGITMLATSCTDDFVDNIKGYGTQNVVDIEFVFNLDGVVVTRAISDGLSVDKMMYAIITEDGEVVSRSSRLLREQEIAESAVKMSVTLGTGGNYKAVFWAQSSECKAYTMNEDLSIDVNYEGMNNDENRDAFYGVSELFSYEDGRVDVTLKRPFAQLNAGTYLFDWKYAKEQYDYEVTKSAVKVRNVPNRLNLLNGEVSGNVDAYYYASALPTERLKVDLDANGEDEEYFYLSMSYVLASEDETFHSADFYFMNDKNQTVVFTNEPSEAVALQRNCRTDYVGQVLTRNGKLNLCDYVAAQTVYYNVSEPTTISNVVYNMSGYDSIRFASENGQLVTLNDVYITGDIWTIELGEYRGPSYVNYNNVLNRFTLNDVRTSVVIECHEWYFSPAVIAYGNSEINNSTMTGTTTIVDEVTDKHGVTHQVIPVDLGVRNESDCVINGCLYTSVFAWTHAVVDIHGAQIGTLYCGTCDSTKHSLMTIHDKTVIDSIICCEPRCPYGGKEYSTKMTIKKGAVVGTLQLVSTDVEFLIIEDGAQVGKIICDGVEYTYKELRSAMGL